MNIFNRRHLVHFSMLLIAAAAAGCAGTPAVQGGADARPAATPAAASAEASRTPQQRFAVAVHNDNVAEMEKLLDSGVDINAWDEDGYTALSMATQHGFVPSVQLLLDRKADPNKPDRDSGWRPITFAAFFGYDRVAAMLLDAGADVNATNENGDRALLHAVFRGQTHIVKLLLERGADFRPANSKGYTPLMAAEYRRHPDIAKILKSAGAKQ